MKYWRYILAFIILGVSFYFQFLPYLVEYDELAKGSHSLTSGPTISAVPTPTKAAPVDLSHLSQFALLFNLLGLAAACVTTWLTILVFRKISGGVLGYPWIVLMLASVMFLISKALWVMTTLRIIPIGFDASYVTEFLFIIAFMAAAILQRKSLS